MKEILKIQFRPLEFFNESTATPFQITTGPIRVASRDAGRYLPNISVSFLVFLVFTRRHQKIQQ